MADAVDGFARQVWRIFGYDSTDRIFEMEIPQAELQPLQVAALLRYLVARNLSPDEIVAAVRGETSFLEVRDNTEGGNRFSFMAGENPYYVAGLFRADEKPA